LAQLANQALQGIVDTAGHQALVDLVALAYLGILVSVALVYLDGQDLVVSADGLAKSVHLVPVVGQVSVVGQVLAGIAVQVYLAGQVIVVIAVLVCQGTQGILDQALQVLADLVVYLDGLVKMGHQVFQVLADIVDQVYQGIQDSAVSVVGLGFQDIADQVYLAIQGTQGILA
jgi:hypothetical protein